MVDAIKIFLTLSLITMHNLVAVSHTVCAHLRDPKNCGDAGPRLLELGMWLTPCSTLIPLMCYIPSFSRHRLGVGRGPTKLAEAVMDGRALVWHCVID